MTSLEFTLRKAMRKSFQQSVRDVVKQIPMGKTLTYTEVAVLAGNPRAYRAVGTILSKNYDSAVPCHRVVRSDGKIGGYNRGVDRKRVLLEQERRLTVSLPKDMFAGKMEEKKYVA